MAKSLLTELLAIDAYKQLLKNPNHDKKDLLISIIKRSDMYKKAMNIQ